MCQSGRGSLGSGRMWKIEGNLECQSRGQSMLKVGLGVSLEMIVYIGGHLYLAC